MTMIFDTLKLSKSLQPAFTPAQAEAMTEALAHSTLETVATKTDIAALRVEIANLKSELIKWIVGAIAFNFVATAALVITLVKEFGH